MIGLRAPVESREWPDLRLVPAAFGTWFVALGVLTLGWSRGWALVVVGGLALAGATVAVARHRSPVVRSCTFSVVVLLLAVVAVGAVSLARVGSVRPPLVRELIDRRAVGVVELVVTSDPAPLPGRWSSGRVRVAARLEHVTTSRLSADLRVPVMVFAPSSWHALLPGARVRTRAAFAATTYRDEAALLTARGAPILLAPAGRIQRAAGILRAGLRASVAGFAPDPRGLVPGMVLGDTTGVSAQLKADERVAGLTHLTAVSGANVAILLAAVLGVARCFGFRRRMLLVIGLIAVIAFVIVARPAPSVLRAAVMGCVALIGIARGTTGRGLQILASGVIVLLAVNPWLALSWGFALSVVATAALLLVAPRWREQLSSRLAPRLAEPLAVAAVAHIATLPLIAALSGRVSLVAVAANVAAEPAVVLVTVSGAAATVVSPVSPAVAQWCAWPAGWGAWWVAEVAHRAARWPLADVPWPSGPVGVSVLAAGSLAVLLCGPAAGSALVRSRVARAVGGPWHASRDASSSHAPAGRDADRRTGGPPRRARRRRGRHRRPRRRSGGRRPRTRHR